MQRLALACVLSLACAHKAPPEPGATTAASSMPSNAAPASAATPAEASRAQQAAAPGPSAGAPAAGAPAASSTQPVARGPLTAAEAAEMASRQPRGGGDGGQAAADDAAPCSSDADCTLTRHPPGSSCPSLCVPRAVTRAEAERLEQSGDRARCVMPMCRPPPGQTLPACVQNRCVEKSGGPSY